MALRRQPPGELLAQAREGSRAALARLLTYVENGGALHDETVALTYAAPAPYVIGLTGAPGAGKSTLTDQLLRVALECHPEDPLAVLCVDPSSPFSGGALLGDRVRMQDHATDPRVYIRSLATRGRLGGLSLAVPDAVHVLAATGFSTVLVETVGVGQMEIDIAGAADATVVVLNPGWGDAMQASKAGLLEIADVFVINKADRPGLRETRRDLEQMLEFLDEGERPAIVEVVATEGTGIGALWDALDAFRASVTEGALAAHRRARTEAELIQVLTALQREQLSVWRASEPYAAALADLVAGRSDPYRAARAILSMSC